MHSSLVLAHPRASLSLTGAGLFLRPLHAKPKAVSSHSVTSDGHQIAPSNNFDPTRARPWIDPTEPGDVLVPKLDGWTPVDSISSTLATKEMIREGNDSEAKLLQSVIPRHQPAQIVASAPIGIWEGEVLQVDLVNRRFSAKLVPLRGADIEMSGDISFNQINPDDRPLLIPGSVFYIEQYSRFIKKQISYDQHVRFRRLPKWTEEMIGNVAAAAAELEGIDLERQASY